MKQTNGKNRLIILSDKNVMGCNTGKSNNTSCYAAGIVKHCNPSLYKVIVFFLLFFSTSLKGQGTIDIQQISVNDTILTVQQAFQLISKLTSLNFSYNPDIIDISKKIRIAAHQESLNSILNQLLEDPTLKYRIIGRQIIIYRPLKRIIPDNSAAIYSIDSIYIIEITGRVLDIHNRKPIPFANIWIVNKGTGTVSNLEGYFILKINSQYLNDTIGISCMGYKRMLLPVIDFIAESRNIFLAADLIPIQEVIIRQTNPISLLHSAIENIPKNYPNKPALLTSFYREIIRKNDNIMAVSEAILQTYKTAYNYGGSLDQIKLIKGRKTKDISGKDSIILKLKAGLNTTLLLDIIKHIPDFLTEENFGAYSYKMKDIIVNNQDELYLIQFTPRKDFRDAIYKGNIYLNISTLAIVEVEFEVDPLKIEEAADMFVLKKPRNIKVKPQEAKYRVAFKKTGEKYYLNLIRCETAFRIRQKSQLFGSLYQTSLEMAVTQIDTADIEKFRIKEIAHTYEIFSELVQQYEDDFWGSFNYIKPEEPLEEAIKNLSQN
jgi:hypothetical protein